MFYIFVQIDFSIIYYIVNVYRDAALVYSQVVASGDVVNFEPNLTYDYGVKVQAMSDDINYTDSEQSANYVWSLTAGEVQVEPSKFCNYQFGSSANNFANITWETDLNGDIVITISGYAGDMGTYFRSNGMGGDLNGFKVNGADASLYFDRVYTANENSYILQLKDGVNLVEGDKISYSGTIEWVTSKDNNAWGSYTFNDYIYGSDCSGLPNVSADPANITFDPVTGVQSFVLTGANLEGDITIIPPRGITVSPAVITPVDGEVNQAITVNWTTGTTDGAIIRITGGGLVSDVPVLVNTIGFSDYCNKVIYQQNSSNWGAYLGIGMSEDSTEMVFTIAPLHDGETAVWNRIVNISVNDGENNELVASNIRSEDGSTITVTFNAPLSLGDEVKFGAPMVWEITGEQSNNNVFTDALQGPFVVGESCELSPGTGVDKIMTNKVTVYPNPATEILYFTSHVRQAQVYSLMGQQLIAVANSEFINVSSLAKGLYIVTVVDDNGQFSSQKFEVR